MSVEINCENCEYSRPTHDSSYNREEVSEDFDYGLAKYCHRYPPTTGFPLIVDPLRDWCGDHSKLEEWRAK